MPTKDTLHIGGLDLPLFSCDGHLLRHVRLEAASTRGAWYELKLLRIQDGYLIDKISGAEGMKPHTETWFRKGFQEAVSKFEAIVREKTNPISRRPRHYQVVLREEGSVDGIASENKI